MAAGTHTSRCTLLALTDYQAETSPGHTHNPALCILSALSRLDLVQSKFSAKEKKNLERCVKKATKELSIARLRRSRPQCVCFVLGDPRCLIGVPHGSGMGYVLLCC